ncbi:MAG: hypothetical protein K0Q50_226 [Vampirovibrio sp.]|jgi:hypothetical protein|nr:hypothetical protein [Vampirovibrio sp.]
MEKGHIGWSPDYQTQYRGEFMGFQVYTDPKIDPDLLVMKPGGMLPFNPEVDKLQAENAQLKAKLGMMETEFHCKGQKLAQVNEVVAQLRTVEKEYESEIAENKAKMAMMVKAIEQAPCSYTCESRMSIPSMGILLECNCWKKQTLSATSADVERWEIEKRAKVIQECIEVAEKSVTHCSTPAEQRYLVSEALQSLLPKQEGGR